MEGRGEDGSAYLIFHYTFFLLQVLFAVPFHVPYTQDGKKRRLKVVAKIQYFISSLMPNEVSNAKSRLETLIL